MTQQKRKASKNTLPSLDSEDVYALDPESPEQKAYDMSRGKGIFSQFPNDVNGHNHNGEDSKRINVFQLVGMLKTVSATPTWVPVIFAEQFAFYENGGTRRLYVYGVDQNGTGTWRYVALT